MIDDHPFHIDYHARAFELIWEALDSRLAELGEAYGAEPRDENEQEDFFYMGLFVQAAGSHIHVVSACTLLESLISKEFQQYGQWLKDRGSPDHFRWQQPLDEAVNPRRVFREDGQLKDRNNFIDGHIQLCEACNISDYLNEEFVQFLRAMLFYRNYIVHNGLEWGDANVTEFKAKVGSANISMYFDKAISGERDWVYTLKADTILKLRNHVGAMITNLDEMFWSSMFDVYSRQDLENAAKDSL